MKRCLLYVTMIAASMVASAQSTSDTAKRALVLSGTVHTTGKKTLSAQMPLGKGAILEVTSEGEGKLQVKIPGSDQLGWIEEADTAISYGAEGTCFELSLDKALRTKAVDADWKTVDIEDATSLFALDAKLKSELSVDLCIKYVPGLVLESSNAGDQNGGTGRCRVKGSGKWEMFPTFEIAPKGEVEIETETHCLQASKDLPDLGTVYKQSKLGETNAKLQALLQRSSLLNQLIEHHISLQCAIWLQQGPTDCGFLGCIFGGAAIQLAPIYEGVGQRVMVHADSEWTCHNTHHHVESKELTRTLDQISTDSRSLAKDIISGWVPVGSSNSEALTEVLETLEDGGYLPSFKLDDLK